jgi:GT2 family glycosyltransferase
MIEGSQKDSLYRNLPTISIIIPTYGRPKSLEEVFKTILKQNYQPLDVIVVDDSPTDDVENVINAYGSYFNSVNCLLIFQKGLNQGLPAARNLGVSLCKGDILLFLDDDVLLDHKLLYCLANFLRAEKSALGVQPKVVNYGERNNVTWKFNNAAKKALGLCYYSEGKQIMRKSGEPVNSINEFSLIPALHLSGCCCCYRKEVFDYLRFDLNLKRWAYKEDLDFSYRVHKKWRNSLWVIPNSFVIHKETRESRLENKSRIYMEVTYSFYIFFKDFFNSSFTNLIAFFWSIIGYFILEVFLVFKGKKVEERPRVLLYPLQAFMKCLVNLKNILKAKIDFFNNDLRTQ